MITALALLLGVSLVINAVQFIDRAFLKRDLRDLNVRNGRLCWEIQAANESAELRRRLNLR